MNKHTHHINIHTHPPPRASPLSPRPPRAAFSRARWEHALAIGDGENDLPMLRRAGISVAMGNGGPAMRQAAMHVVGSNVDDGWSEAMEQFVLGVAVG
jgi:phosphoglycolate phosphatase-like HAD superfamily hydrolase